MISKKINLNDMKNKIIKIIDNNNYSLPSQEWYKLKDKIKDSQFIMTKFSSLLYQQYKDFELNIENFEAFIKLNYYKNKKKSESFWNNINNVLSNVKDLIFKPDDDFIDIINDNLKKNYMAIDPYFKPNRKDFNEYYKRLVDLLTPYDKDYKIKNGIKNELLNEIVKNYLYMKTNIKKHKFYENSFYEQLVQEYGKILKNSTIFFDEKRVNDVLNYMIDCYIAIIEVLKRVELSIRGDSNSEFGSIKIEDVKNEIDDKYNTCKNNIEFQLIQTKINIDNNIENNFSKQKFPNLVEVNNKFIAKLKDYVDTECNNFGEFIKRKNQDIIDKLELKTLEEEKAKFLENMKKFKGEKMAESNKTSNDYTITNSFLFFKWFDYNASKQCYQNAIDQYFNENRDNIINNLTDNRNNGKRNIERIYDVFIDNIKGLKTNFSYFEKIVKNIEDFIYRLFGIKD
jgi:hypothetical protein